MKILLFLAVLVLSHFGVLQVFRLTTYFRYFWKALPILVIYSAGVGWIYFTLELHQFVTWQLVFASLWLFFVWKRQSQAREVFLSKVASDPEMSQIMQSSIANTSGYFIASSLIYLAVFTTSYLWLLNKWLF